MSNVDVRKGREGGFGQMQTPEDRGVGKWVIFVDNPLRGSVSDHGSILGFGSLEKVKNH